MASEHANETPLVGYVGSSLHKRYRSHVGGPRLLSTKDPCPDEIRYAEAAHVLCSAITASLAAGRHSRLRDGLWPRYAWGRSSFQTIAGGRLEVTWEARLTNRSAVPPEYKAYPVRRDRHSQQMPLEVRKLLWPQEP